MNKETNKSTAFVPGSDMLKEGRADVARIRERSRRKRVARLFALFVIADGYLLYRFLSHKPIQLPHLSPPVLIMLPILFFAFVMVAYFVWMIFSSRSPHTLVRPEDIEVGLDEVVGLPTQVEEVRRTLDVFLGYATFRSELGGNPRRGVLFEGPPGTGKTYLAKATAKQAGVPFLFVAAPAFQTVWQGLSQYRVRQFFKALRNTARREGGAIGFIEEIDAIGGLRGGIFHSDEAGSGAREISSFVGSGENSAAMLNQLLIQMQSFDQPPMRQRVKNRFIEWLNGYLPKDKRMRIGSPKYHNILVFAATNRADVLDPALLRPGRFDQRLYFDPPTKQGRRELTDFFLDRKAHNRQLDEEGTREQLARDTFGYTPVMLEHLFDEALLLALKHGRREMNFDDVYEAKLTDEVGLKQPVIYTTDEREAIATHEAGHATVAHFLGKDRRLEVLSIIKRRRSLGVLAHGDREERFTRTRSEIEGLIAIALGGMAAEEIYLG